jgi:hypothetical protein
VRAMFTASMPAMCRFDSLFARVSLRFCSVGALAKTETFGWLVFVW